MVRTGLGFEVYPGLEVEVGSSWKRPWLTVIEISQKRFSPKLECSFGVQVVRVRASNLVVGSARAPDVQMLTLESLTKRKGVSTFV
jgi:hypothetical protein